MGGCTHVSTGCRNCYAQREAGTRQTRHRIALHEETTDWHRGRPVWNGRLAVWPPDHPGWTWPLRWRGADNPVLGAGKPSLVFVADMADLFHEGRPTGIIDEVVATIVASRHIGQLLTKRAERMVEYFTGPRSDQTLERWQRKLWLGFSAERQREFDARWSHMRELAARGWTVFASLAPLIAPMTLPPDFLAHGERIWVIASGEQGANARAMDAAWAGAVKDQCAAAGVPFFMLQMAHKRPIPPDLLVREFPRVADEVIARRTTPSSASRLAAEDGAHQRASRTCGDRNEIENREGPRRES